MLQFGQGNEGEMGATNGRQAPAETRRIGRCRVVERRTPCSTAALPRVDGRPQGESGCRFGSPVSVGHFISPGHDPRPEKEDGGLDWAQVTEIVVEEVIDYH